MAHYTIKYTFSYNENDDKHKIIATVNGVKIGKYPNIKKARKLAPIKLKNIIRGYDSTEKCKRVKNAIKQL
jgi:hypothetical protein